MNILTIDQPLVSVEWLHQNLNAPNLVILEATIPKVKIPDMPKAYQHFDIPGARFFDLKKIFRDLDSPLSNTMPSPQKFEREIGKLGISNESAIVVYDHWGIYSSARVWWMFKVMGHENIAVLDGGFPAWAAQNYQTEPTQDYSGPISSFQAHYQPAKMSDGDFVLGKMNDENSVILDARSEGRFYATAPEPRAELRGGHIPRSHSLHYARLMKDGLFLSENELVNLFQQYADADKELIFSCGSGITACILALGAEKAGFDKLTVYDGSWTEWGGDERFLLKFSLSLFLFKLPTTLL